MDPRQNHDSRAWSNACHTLMGIGYNSWNWTHVCQNYDELVEKVRRQLPKAKPGDWINREAGIKTNGSSSQKQWSKLSQQTTLNEVSADNPVFLRTCVWTCFHLQMTKQLELLVISNLKGESGESSRWRIILDDLGNPTGVLTERVLRI